MRHVPRVVDFVTVKRNVPLTGRSYGHWWVELDGEESYGWWPARAPLGLGGIVCGTSGTLNGLGVSGSGGRTRDANHGLLADHEFHPVSVTARTDDEIRDDIRLFASTFAGRWRWSVRPTMNCRLFQLALMEAAGLVDGTGNYHTRGGGCPALLPGRWLLARITGRRSWPCNMPRPGQRIADLDDIHGNVLRTRAVSAARISVITKFRRRRPERGRSALVESVVEPTGAAATRCRVSAGCACDGSVTSSSPESTCEPTEAST